MSRYFKPYEENEDDPIYPKNVKMIRHNIENSFGKFDCTNRKIGELWRDFSEEKYSASFLIPEWHFIKEFVEWLKEQED